MGVCSDTLRELAPGASLRAFPGAGCAKLSLLPAGDPGELLGAVHGLGAVSSLRGFVASRVSSGVSTQLT